MSTLQPELQIGKKRHYPTCPVAHVCVLAKCLENNVLCCRLPTRLRALCGRWACGTGCRTRPPTASWRSRGRCTLWAWPRPARGAWPTAWATRALSRSSTPRAAPRCAAGLPLGRQMELASGTGHSCNRTRLCTEWDACAGAGGQAHGHALHSHGAPLKCCGRLIRPADCVVRLLRQQGAPSCTFWDLTSYCITAGRIQASVLSALLRGASLLHDVSK